MFSAAFPNCVFEDIRTTYCPGINVMTVAEGVAGSMVITVELYLGMDTLPSLRSASEIIDFVARF